MGSVHRVGTKQEENYILKTFWEWVEFVARVVVWIFAMVLAIVTVVEVVPVLPERTSLTLLIFLYLFLFAWTIEHIFETRRRFPTRRRGKED